MLILMVVLLPAMAGRLAAVPSLDPAGYPRQRRETTNTPPIFDSEAQKVDVSGDHAFRAPGPEDARGPCPALNAMANHGYLPHNGVATIEQFVAACRRVFNLGSALGLNLALYGAIQCGNIRSWSIGGPMSEVPNPLPGVLGTPGGISNCHNKYESDASCTRRDLYFGDPAPLQMDLFKDLYFGAPGYEYTMKYLNTVSARRFNDSLMTNPYFTVAPLSGVVRIAEFFFMNRMMRNHSAARPEGWFDGVSLKSFFGVTGPDNYLAYRVGYERIPNNWYKRPTPYDFDSVVPDLAAFSTQHPEAVKFGGNIGEPNSFVGIDLKDLTGGALKTEDLLKGDNLPCLLYRLSTDVVGDMVEGAEFLKGLTGMSGNSSTPRGCPQFIKIDLTPFLQFPGFNASRPAIDPK